MSAPFTFDQYVDRVFPTSNTSEDEKLTIKQAFASVNNGNDESHKKLVIDRVFQTVSNEASVRSQLQSMDLSSLQDLFTYIYPKPDNGPLGTCAKKIPNETPFNLATEVYGLPLSEFNDENRLKNSVHSLRVKQLRELIAQLQQEQVISCEWFGIYRAIPEPNFLNYRPSDGFSVLVKEAYTGDFSRPDFPLNEQFAKHSSNTNVGLSGKMRVIHDVYGSLSLEGDGVDGAESTPYYVCDTRVESELCLPIFDREGSEVIGIVDAEAWKTHFCASPLTLFHFMYICYLLGQYQLFL